MFAQQPIDRIAIPDADLRGSWLGKAVAHRNLGVDASPAGDDLTPVNAPTAERVGCTFVAASLQYLRRAEAAWNVGDSFGVVSAWIKLSSVGVIHRIFTTADEAGDNDYWAFSVDAANHLCLSANIGGVARSVAGGTALVADRWYRVSGMSDGGTWALYVDEDIETLTPAGAGNDGSWLGDVANRDNVCIGALRTNTILEYFDGTIKDVRCRGLTVDVPDDVVADFRRSVPDPDLALWTVGGPTDLSRYERALTWYNDTIVGHEMTFDGTTDYMRTAAIELTAGASVSLWFNPAAVGTAVLFNDAIHLDRRLVILLEAAGEIRAGYWQGAVYRAKSGTAYQANKWNHVFVTWDADETLRMWLDGVELTGTTDPSSGNALFLRLGSSTSGTSYYTGLMRDFRMWMVDKGPDYGPMLYERTRRAY